MTTTDQPTGRDGPARSRRIQAVDHAIDVLDAMAQIGFDAGVSEIARRTGLSKAAVHHLLSTLESRRFVMRDPTTARYRLSWALYELGSNVVRSVDVTRTARPFLDRLASQTGESVLLGILDEDAVLYLDRGEAPQGLRMTANAGRRSPLHSTASGKVLLAFAQDRQLFDRITVGPLAKFTQTTIIDPSVLRYELAQVRQQGFATCWQEREVGLCSLAVPLRNYTNQVIGSLAVAGPSTRLNSRTVQEHLRPLQAAGHNIQVRLGASPAEDAPR